MMVMISNGIAQQSRGRDTGDRQSGIDTDISRSRLRHGRLRFGIPSL